eukprot:TRINITY_DN15055_c0_g1_i1.p1 TRINITY_DN15055_c0_g1~~TRINITY_DN15055_c0_g1_i1.p1  ORF type:complete len:340 (+),score=83.19 TRINITY_DN15055_c0_g1_i1:26-1021(+)
MAHRQAKNQRAKRAMDARLPRLVESVKVPMLIHGQSCNQTMAAFLSDLHLLRKPHSVHLSKKNPVVPFEDATPLEFLSTKNDASLFAIGTHTKKRPDNVIFGRMFEHQLLDMIEFGVTEFRSLASFAGPAPALGFKPLLVFSGQCFDDHPDYIAARDMLLEFFRGERATRINLVGLDHVISVSAATPDPDSTDPAVARPPIRVRTSRVVLLKSGSTLPRVELEDSGPSFDLHIRRRRAADPALYAEAMRQPKSAKEGKKNIEKGPLTQQLGRVHVEQQDLATLQTRKMKGLKRKKGEDDPPEEAPEDAPPPAKKPKTAKQIRRELRAAALD